MLYHRKRDTIQAEQFTPERAEQLREALALRRSIAPFSMPAGGGYHIDCGGDKRVAFGDYILIASDGKPCDVVGQESFEADYEALPMIPVAPPAARRSAAPVAPDKELPTT